jgi:hypothetical protein
LDKDCDEDKKRMKGKIEELEVELRHKEEQTSKPKYGRRGKEKDQQEEINDLTEEVRMLKEELKQARYKDGG